MGPKESKLAILDDLGSKTTPRGVQNDPPGPNRSKMTRIVIWWGVSPRNPEGVSKGGKMTFPRAILARLVPKGSKLAILDDLESKRVKISYFGRFRVQIGYFGRFRVQKDPPGEPWAQIRSKMARIIIWWGVLPRNPEGVSKGGKMTFPMAITNNNQTTENTKPSNSLVLSIYLYNISIHFIQIYIYIYIYIHIYIYISHYLCHEILQVHAEIRSEVGAK